MNYDDALKLEDKRLSRLLSNYPGRHLLQLSRHDLSSLACSPIPHKFRVSQHPAPDTVSKDCAFLQSSYTELPFASDSINLIILPHTLEHDKQAKHRLSEAWRVLTPNGHLIILGINPTSLWGLYSLFSYKALPWSGYFYTMPTLCQWIQHLGGQICHTESFFFRPPLTSRPGGWLFDKLFWLERISPWLFPYLGGIYLIIAQKHIKRLSRLGLVWQFAPVLAGKALASNVRGALRAQTP